MGVRRALFHGHWNGLTDEQLLFIQSKSSNYEELIFVIDDEESCGQIMMNLQGIFSDALQRPYYLLPIGRKGCSDASYNIRRKILCPPFQTIYSCPSIGNSIPLKQTMEKRRGLFITKAQPFHHGHLRLLEQMNAEVDEIIIVIAMANLSHGPAHIATGGERLAMMHPLLHAQFPKRFYLVALPYNDFTMENMYELEYLLPKFHAVYTNNPVLMAMVHSTGYPTRSQETGCAISSTAVRNCMLHDLPFDQLVPKPILDSLISFGIPERLKLIHEKEQR